MKNDDVLIGRYRLISQIGAGGFGTVWKAFDERMRRFIAIKVISENAPTSAKMEQRFWNEAIITGSLSHPNIVTIHDFGGEWHSGENRYITFLVMELLEGQPLTRVLATRRPGVAEAIRWGIQIAAALEAAHENGVIHRDVKPSNIHVLKNGRQLKLLDFGIAKSRILAADLTAEGHWVGTEPYMAPERFTSKRIDPKTDLYSLGCVLYELLTGRSPYLLTPLAPPSAGNPEVPGAVDELLSALLASDPDQRLESAETARSALTDIAASLGSVDLTGAEKGQGAPRVPAPGESEATPAEASPIASWHCHDGGVYTVRFWDGATLISGGEDSLIKMWSTNDRKHLRSLVGHAPGFWNRGVRDLALSPGKGLLASAGFDATVRLWGIPEGEAVRTLKQGPSLFTYYDSVSFSPDGRLIAAAANGSSGINLWEQGTGILLHRLNLGGNRVAFTPDGRLLASNGQDKVVRMWDVGSGRLVHSLNRQRKPIRDLSFDPTGQHLATAGDDKKVRVWETANWSIVLTTNEEHAVSKVRYSPSGRFLAVCASNLAYLRDSLDGRLLSIIRGNGSPIVDLDFSPDESLLATAAGNALQLWNISEVSNTLHDGGERTR
ncbi:serine/threonine-protein kinase [Streptomyces griseoflavus]|uniref:WD40 repeat domain-containing serine/threonine protein kinase n=1 Tax=Streptomyces griseoflavus TaxID=35619 RepID=UPI0033A47286